MSLFKSMASATSKVNGRDLINKESKIGSKIFGPVPAGHRREFFCLDEHTWVWFEEWTELDGSTKNLTTRYEITPHGIIKAQDGQPYRYVEGRELRTLIKAMREYRIRVGREIYGRAY